VGTINASNFGNVMGLVGLLFGAVAVGGCDEGTGEPRGFSGAADAERAGELGSCNALGYTGTCVDDVSLWMEGGACRVRDCASEGKTCGLISNEVGYGCLQGTAGSTQFLCTDVGYAGVCLEGDVLVWSEGETCQWADCAALGYACGWTDSVGYDCVAGGGDGGGGDGGGGDGGGGGGGGLLTVGEMLGGLSYGLSQAYGPTTYDYDYSYCQAYGDWGGQHVHCGVDIPIVAGTPLYIPGDATVMIAGESPYFEDDTNPAAGELKLKMSHDGAEVIMGHMSAIDVGDGTHVAAGQWAGRSGSSGGAHLHLEVRVPDASMPSGLRTVDPMQYFGW
jgi:hypothetical protein